MIPSYLGIQLSIAYLLGSKLNSILFKNWHNQFWNITLMALLTSGIISCTVVSQAQTWWNNLTDTHNEQLAQIINQATHPLIIQEVASSPPRYNVFNLVSLSYLLKPEVQFKFIPKDTTTEIPKTFINVFFVSPSPVLKSGIEKEYRVKIQPIEGVPKNRLWKLVKS
jgi:uncharacterized membrane protein